MTMKIIGITGTLGAWKGTVVDYLVEKKDYDHFSVRAFLTEEIERRNLPVDRDSMREIANELRAEHGPAYVVKQLFLKAQQWYKDAIIESIRAVGEVTALKEEDNFFFLWVDADQKLRYERAVKRGSETDHVSFEEFQRQEALEMSNTDPSKQNLGACMQLADKVVFNNGTLEELYQQLEDIM